LTNSGAARADAVALAREPLVLDDLLENGQGVGRAGGFVTFVTGGLPGERVRIAVDEIKRKYASAHALEIEQASPDRVDPRCDVFPQCGGCQTRHLRYAAELEWKRRLVTDALVRLGGLRDIRVSEVWRARRAENAGYRNKVTLVCSVRSGQARLGFYSARSHRLVPIATCPVLVERLDEAVKGLVAFAGAAPEALRGVDHIVARASTTGSDLVMSFNGREPNRTLAASLGELRRHVGSVSGVVTSWDPSSENAVFGRRAATLWGSGIVRERVGAAAFSFGVASFFQINTPVLEEIGARVVTMLEGAGRVVDLYCGVGTFGVLLGKQGIASTGVESFAPAVDEARANAAENGVTSAQFECAAASAALAGERGRTLLAGASAVIVDPPRKGCEDGVIDGIARSRVARVIYISCNPATLARDAKLLLAAGYRMGAVAPFDMFPRTGHVELLAEFTRQ